MQNKHKRATHTREQNTRKRAKHTKTHLVIVSRLTSGAVFASLHRSFAAVARIEADVAVFPRPGQIADAFVRVDQIQAFAVGAGARLAVVLVDVAIGAGVAFDTNAFVGGFLAAAVAAVLARIRQTPVDAAFASRPRVAQRTVAGESETEEVGDGKTYD